MELPKDLIRRIDDLMEPLPPKLRRSDGIQRLRDILIQGIVHFAERSAIEAVETVTDEEWETLIALREGKARVVLT